MSNGWEIFNEVLAACWHKPILLWPLVIALLLIMPICGGLILTVDTEALTRGERIGFLLGVVFIATFIVVFSSSVLLELIQQMETLRRPPSLWRAIVDSIGFNLVKLIPLSVVWTLVWFVLTVLETLMGDGGRRGRRSPNVAETALIAAKKGVRMAVFLIMPAIAWENMGFFEAVRRGSALLRENIGEFLTGFVITALAQYVIMMPVFLAAAYSYIANVELSQNVWLGVYVFMFILWSISVYMEQLFAAELYLWHLQWERECLMAKSRAERPSLEDVPMPSLLDDVPDLLPEKYRLKKPAPAVKVDDDLAAWK
jgi:hypothetical protein